ncbi:MAG: DUF5985 family protein [Acidobacteriota bacterium]
MNSILYVVTALTTLLCAVLLLRAYFRVRRALLLWSGLCFVLLTVSYFLVWADLVLVPDSEWYTARLIPTAAAMALLLVGLVWESR